MIPTTVSSVAKIGKGTALQMNYGSVETPEWKTIPGVMTQGEAGHDQDFEDNTALADEHSSSIAGDAVAKERLITFKDVPGDTDLQTFVTKANANEVVQLKEVHSTGRTFTGLYLLSKPYWGEVDRKTSVMGSVKASPQGEIVPGLVA